MKSSSPPLHVLHVASEVAPFSKTGGLADVAAALPSALVHTGRNVRATVVTPRYQSIDPGHYTLARRLEPLDVPLGKQVERVVVYEGRLAGGGPACYFLDHPLFHSEGGLYGDAAGDYPDNGRRFALLSRGALELMHRLGDWPDVVHGHDWQAGLAAYWAKRGGVGGRPAPRTVMTIHNLAFQGLMPKSLVEELGLGWDIYHPDAGEFYDQLSLLKLGLAFADRITTVSPRYAREIQTPERGAGLDGFLRANAGKLTGILNGIDADLWDPSRDANLAARYDADDRAGKIACKTALQRELGLGVRTTTPLFVSISRLTDQKGFDLITKAGQDLARFEAQFAFLGTGEERYEKALTELARRFPSKVAVRIAYDERLAHRMEAGGDLFLMPSQFEPCGLNQLYSLRYGTIPLVRATGGLDDTIVDFDLKTRTGTGFKFLEATPTALVNSVRRALATYQHKDAWDTLVGRAMKQDVSWGASAGRYVDVYRALGGNGSSALAS